MTSRLFQVLTVALFAFIPSASPSSESEIQPLFDLSAMSTGPVPQRPIHRARREPTHRPPGEPATARRRSRPSDCADTNVINTLDGFNLQPRLSIPFSGAIDPGTVNSDTVFLLSWRTPSRRTMADGAVIGINQTVWDVATNTLHVESNDLLEQHTRYALIVTRGVHDASGQPIERSTRTSSAFATT